METLNEVNELLTTKMCSPVIIYGVILVLSLICVYMVRQRLGRYNTMKMENLYNLYSAQDLISRDFSDFVGFAQSLIADPKMIIKTITGNAISLSATSGGSEMAGAR